MSCESELDDQLKEAIDDGATKNDLIDFIDRVGIEYQDIRAENFQKYGERPDELIDLHGLIVVAVEENANGDTKSEFRIGRNQLIRIGYDESGALVSYQCRTIFTGP